MTGRDLIKKLLDRNLDLPLYFSSAQDGKLVLRELAIIREMPQGQAGIPRTDDHEESALLLHTYRISKDAT